MKMKRILIAVDSQTCADILADFLTSHRWSADSTFLILHVIDTEVVLDIEPKYWEAALLKADSRGHALVKGLADKIRQADSNLVVEEVVVQGNPKDCILDTVTDWKADLVVLGSHGRRGFTRFLLGSVSAAVTSHAPCSALVVRMVHPSASDKESASTAVSKP